MVGIMLRRVEEHSISFSFAGNKKEKSKMFFLCKGRALLSPHLQPVFALLPSF